MNNEVSFKFEEIEKLDNSAKYIINIALSMDIGWIDYIELVIEESNKTTAFKLDHVKNENNKAIVKIFLFIFVLQFVS